MVDEYWSHGVDLMDILHGSAGVLFQIRRLDLLLVDCDECMLSPRSPKHIRLFPILHAMGKENISDGVICSSYHFSMTGIIYRICIAAV